MRHRKRLSGRWQSLLQLFLREEEGLQHPSRAGSRYPVHRGSMASMPAVVEDISPWVCSWRDALGLVALWVSPYARRQH